MDNYEKYVGQIFDNRYRIERVIGIGGMAIGFKATDLLMRRIQGDRNAVPPEYCEHL